MGAQSLSFIATEDGSLNLGSAVEKIVYHQSLNVFIVLSKNKIVRVFDPHTSQQLADVSFKKYVADSFHNVQCLYHKKSGGILFSGGSKLGFRLDHQGVLLLHTILQTQVATPEESVTLEILLSEALQLQQVLREVNNLQNSNLVLDTLSKAISQPPISTYSNPKVAKWHTVCVTMNFGELQLACASLVSELRQMAYFIPSLSLASGLFHRLNNLMPSLVSELTDAEKKPMFSEAARLSTFSKWPHTNYKWALPDHMAQAGFYYQPVANDDDRALCFVCNVCLVYWEPTDEPWSEHERHSPNCPYVKGEYTHNVPLSITQATSPAIAHSEAGTAIHRISSSNSDSFVATTTASGNIVIWNIKKQWKKEVVFSINPSDAIISDEHFSDSIGYSDVPLQATKMNGDNPFTTLCQLNLGITDDKHLSVRQSLASISQCEITTESDGVVVSTSDNDLLGTSNKENIIASSSECANNLYDELPGSSSPKTSTTENKVDISSSEIKSPADTTPVISATNTEVAKQEASFIKADPTNPSTLGAGSKDSNADSISAFIEFNEALRDSSFSFTKSGVPSKKSIRKSSSEHLLTPLRPSRDLRVSSLCVFSDPSALESTSSIDIRRSSLAVGISIRRYELSCVSQGIVEILPVAHSVPYEGGSKGPLSRNLDDTCSENGRIIDQLPSGSVDSSCNNDGENSANYVPYILVYDLSTLIEDPVTPLVKQDSITAPKSSSKKNRKSVLASCYPIIKPKYEIVLDDSGMSFIPEYNWNMKEQKSTVQDNTSPKKTPRCIQCIPLPKTLSDEKLQLCIDHIILTPCDRFLLISLCQRNNTSELVNGADLSSITKGGFILYRICDNDQFLSLHDEPLAINYFQDFNLIAKEITIIPYMRNYDKQYNMISENCLAGVVCMDGNLRILCVSTLNYLHEICPPDEKFISLDYCHSLERLCVTSENGRTSLIKIQVNHESGLNRKSYLDDCIFINVDHNGSFSDGGIDWSSPDLLVNQEITEDLIDKCSALTQFERRCPKIVATVPPCWMELVQAQKKRRNPQHLQHHSDDVARTWSLEGNSSTSEHLLDFMIPSSRYSEEPIQIAHVNVKLNLACGSLPLPEIQITLLKQNLSNSGSAFEAQEPNSDLDSADNPVISRDFLQSHKAEILCGPVTVNNFIDLSGQVANVTLSSPALFTCNTRTFLIHIKAMDSKDHSNKNVKETSSNSDKNSTQSSCLLEKLSSTSSSQTIKRGEQLTGCDVIREFTLTIHCCSETPIPYERLQRFALIDKHDFHRSLLCAVFSQSTSLHIQHRCLTIFLWVLSIHTATGPSQTSLEGPSKDLIDLLKSSLPELVDVCILGDDRTIAHMAAKIIVLALESLSEGPASKEFSKNVLSALLDNFDGIVKCRSAGGVYWFFSLLNHVKWSDSVAAADKVTELLSVSSKTLSQKVNPVHSLLQTKFGLQRMPFERKLFDTFPPLSQQSLSSSPQKQNPANSSNYYQSNNTSNSILNNNINQNTDWTKLDSSEVFTYGPSQISKGSVGSFLTQLTDRGVGSASSLNGLNGDAAGLGSRVEGLCGLFEVEPLHFTLHMASDGTKMERVFPGANHCSLNSYFVQPLSKVQNLQPPNSSTDNSKLASGSQATKPSSQLYKVVEDMGNMMSKNQEVEDILSDKHTGYYKAKMKVDNKSPEEIYQLLDGLVDISELNKWYSEPLDLSTPDSLSTPTLSSGLSQEDESKIVNGKPAPVPDLSSQVLGEPKTKSDMISNCSKAPVVTEVSETAVKVGDIFATNIEDNIKKEDNCSKMVDSGFNSSPKPENTDEATNNSIIITDNKSDTLSTFNLSSDKINPDVSYETYTDVEDSVWQIEPKGMDVTTPSTTAGAEETDDSGAETLKGTQPSSPTTGVLHHQLLSIPPQQMIVIERMHSGARRFVILDFGAPVVLTDVIIPVCSDLVSLTIDIWLTGEEIDGERLTVASDMDSRPLILADIHPPPLCRFLKMTTLGRYGMVTAQCRIPVGAFYGHTIIMPWHLQPFQPQIGVTSKRLAKTQISILSSLVEDVSCRYSLACYNLEALLQPLLRSSENDFASGKDTTQTTDSKTMNPNCIQEKKITFAYQECLTEQQHLNLILSLLRRLKKYVGTIGLKNEGLSFNSASLSDKSPDLSKCSLDQLSTIVQYLLNCLLTLAYPPSNNSVHMQLESWCGPIQANVLIQNVCLRGTKGIHVAVVSLLSHLCPTQPWWGEFLASTLVSLFSTKDHYYFPANRMFSLVALLGQRSIMSGCGSPVLDAVLSSLLRHLQRGSSAQREAFNGALRGESLFGETQNYVDSRLISWLLLFISLCLDLVNLSDGSENTKANGGRWGWLIAESYLQTKEADPSKGTPKASRELVRRRLFHHKERLVNLRCATKSFKEVLAGLGNVINPKMLKQSEQVFKKIQKQRALKHYKDLCSIQRYETSSLRRMRMNRTPGAYPGVQASHDEQFLLSSEINATVNRSLALDVVKSLVQLLVHSQSSSSSVDSFLLTCKVIGGLAKVSRPALRLSEFLTEDHLVLLLTHCMKMDIGWGSPWAMHALTCLLQDILEGEHLFGSEIVSLIDEDKRNATDNNKGGSSTSVRQAGSGADDAQETSPDDLPWKRSNYDYYLALETSSSESISPNTSFMTTSPGDGVSAVNSVFPSFDAAVFVSDENEPSANVISAEESLSKSNQEKVEVAENGSDVGVAENGSADVVASPVDTTSVLSVTAENHVSESATAVSPPAVDVATSHFISGAESESYQNYKCSSQESEESSGSDEIVEILSFLSSSKEENCPTASTSFQDPELHTGDTAEPVSIPKFCHVLTTKGSSVIQLNPAQVNSIMYKKKLNGSADPSKLPLVRSSDLSAAPYSRQESGVSLTAELCIHAMNAIHDSRLRMAVSAPVQVLSSGWEGNEIYGSGDLKESVNLLSGVFQATFNQISFAFDFSYLDAVLEVWLNLNLGLAGGEYNSSVVPKIPLHPSTISALLSLAARAHSISIRCWCLLLQTLTLCSNLNLPQEASSSLLSQTSISQSIIGDRNFIPVLQKLFCGHFTPGLSTRNDVVGNSLTGYLEDFLLRLQIRCDVISTESVSGHNLKLCLLKLVMRLLEPDGPLARGTGPLDIQKSLLSVMLAVPYNGLSNTNVPLTIISSVATIVSSALCTNQHSASGSLHQRSQDLGGLFASVLGTGDDWQGSAPTRKLILCCLLNLAKKLVEIPLESVKPKSCVPSSNILQTSPVLPSNEYQLRCLTDSIKLEQKQLGLNANRNSQTDEHKAMNPALVPNLNEEAQSRLDVGRAGRSTDQMREQEQWDDLCFHNERNKTVYLADSVIQNVQTMELLLHSLRSCESVSPVPVNLIGAVSGDVSETLGIGKTPSEALYQLFLALNKRATHYDQLLTVLLNYIRPGNVMCESVFSEALYCYFAQVLDCKKMLSKFASMGGTEIIWRNLVKSAGPPSVSHTGLVSTILSQVSPPLPQSTTNSTLLKRIDPTTGSPLTVESSNPKGLYNFAPLSVVTSSNPTVRPADGLVKNTQFFQRAKSPPWSYHFCPEENSVDLNLALPCPILLYEVQMHPHNMSLGMCPSAISLETGIDAGYMIPVTGVVCTAGLTCIQISLKRPVVTSVVLIRLHRPRDQSTIGLSHLKLLGTTTFKNSFNGAFRDNKRPSYWWLKLIDHCIFDVMGGFNLMMESSRMIDGIMEAMVSLLASTSHTVTPSVTFCDITRSSSNNNVDLAHYLSSSLIEITTSSLVNYNPDFLDALLKCLFNHPLMEEPAGTPAIDGVVSLLCMISTVSEGEKLVVEWFVKMVDHQSNIWLNGSHNQIGRKINLEILHCFSVILWNVSDGVAASITDSLFKKLCLWGKKETGLIKDGLDYIICSLCKVQPHLFTQLLLHLGVLTLIDSNTTSISDDSKDRAAEIRASCTDDMKESAESLTVSAESSQYVLQNSSAICLSQLQLQTLSVASQSQLGVQMMLDSGFPLLLVHGILEWCKAELVRQVERCSNAGNVSESATDFEKANVNIDFRIPSASAPENSSGSQDSIPHFSTSLVFSTIEAMTAMCEESAMKSWLGSGDGSVFWMPLLTVLGDPVMHSSEISRIDEPNYDEYCRVEDSTIRLFKTCCTNHTQNQEIFSAILSQLIQRQSIPTSGDLTYLHCLSGFTRRLVLQTMLEPECLIVRVTCSFCLSPAPLHVAPPHSRHPKFGTGNKRRLLYLPVATKIRDIVRMITDCWPQGSDPNQTTTSKDNGSNSDADSTVMQKKEIDEVGLELVDKLSVAAGVSAKDKRMKDKGMKMEYGSACTVKANERTSDSKSTSADGASVPRSDTSYGLVHEDLPGNSIIPGDMTLSQMISVVNSDPVGNNLKEINELKFTLVQVKDLTQDICDTTATDSLMTIKPRPSMLNVFSSIGGLSTLAEHMTLLYPDTSYQFGVPFSNKSCEEDKKEKVEEFQAFPTDMNVSMLDFYSLSPVCGPNSSMGSQALTPMPPHALGSFVLFLRLPGYAETLLKDNAKACSLLRLALGVSNGIYDVDNSSCSEGSLATLPYQVLESLLRATPLTTDDGLMLRKMCLTNGVLNLILACLAALSHQDSPEVVVSLQHEKVPISVFVSAARGADLVQCQERSNTNSRMDSGDRCQYWAKGTGFGTGPISQSWNVEQALVKQRMEEEHIVWFIKILAQYINPGDNLPEDLRESCQEEVDKFKFCSPSGIQTPTPNTTATPNHLLTSAQTGNFETILPAEIYNLFVNAELVKNIAYYLSNDSVLDMSRHVYLYQSIMSIVRAITVTPFLSPLLLYGNELPQGTSPEPGETQDTKKQISHISKPPGDPKITRAQSSSPNLSLLLTKMKNAVDAYLSKLKWSKGARTGPGCANSKSQKMTTESLGGVEPPTKDGKKVGSPHPFFGTADAEDQGLSVLLPDIYLSSKVVQIVVGRLSVENSLGETNRDEASARGTNETVHSSLTDVYLSTMKELQFDSFDIIVEDSERGGIRFTVPYHYENFVRDTDATFNPGRMKRLAQEAVTLSTSLPLSYSSSVFVRMDTDRLDIMKVLITGPEDTPYANGCFEFDVYFSNNYPHSPLYINLRTTGEKRVRFNPNLYQDGKVCLSILNTWHGKPEEKWNPQTSSLLQVLVSIQSLILVSEPYFNEPGYERSRGSQAALHNSQEYDANIQAATTRWAILNQIRNPSPCFKEVIEKHFWLKRKEVLSQVQNWGKELDQLSKQKKAGRVIPQQAAAIKKLHQLLVDEFSKIKTPEGLENVSDTTLDSPTEATNEEARSNEASESPPSEEQDIEQSTAFSASPSASPPIWIGLECFDQYISPMDGCEPGASGNGTSYWSPGATGNGIQMTDVQSYDLDATSSPTSNTLTVDVDQEDVSVVLNNNNKTSLDEPSEGKEST